jgi:replicative DNA helicase Mcm
MITSPTVIVASANATSTVYDADDKIDLDKIPIIKAVLDRFDLVYVLREPIEENEIREYDETKIKKLSEIIVISDNYPYLKKLIAYAKQFKPELSSEAQHMIVEYYTKLYKKHDIQSSATKFKSRRTLETLIRVAKSISKLKLKDTVDVGYQRSFGVFHHCNISIYRINHLYSW